MNRGERMEAVLDRIVDRKYAVLLIGEEEKERIVLLSQLPEGAREGMKFKLTILEDEIKAVDELKEDVIQSEAINEKLALLRKKKQSQFKRS